MTAILSGVRVLEVAEQTFVPSASGLLADWGAEVIKVEHVERGDAMRGLAATGVTEVPSEVHVLFEHSNRGKKSIGLDLTSDEGLEILYKLAATCDVFITNKLPGVRAKLKIELDDIRKANPDIIYARGTGQGERGPEADKGSYDGLSFWARSGVAMGIKRPEYDLVPIPPGAGFGDSLGGMAIAGGILGALFHRLRTGEATTVDVSLLSTAVWGVGQPMAVSMFTGRPHQAPPAHHMGANPLVRMYDTKDGRTLSIMSLQAGKYWPSMAECIGRPELATDERFADHHSLLAHSREAVTILEDAFASATLAEWRERLDAFTGQWCVVQNTVEASVDPQTVANGYVQECVSSKGIPFKLVASPIQFGGEPSQPNRAPDFNEHGDELLADLGMDWDKIIDLKVRGIIA